MSAPKSNDLNDQQQRFVDEYLIDLNATQACIRAGYAEGSARTQGARLLANDNIQKAIQEAKQQRSERTHIDQDWVVKRLAALADADIKRVCSWDASGVYLTDSEELQWRDTYTIQEVILKETIKETEDGKELVMNREKRIKQADKKGSLELLGRHVGMFNDKLKIQGDSEQPLVLDLSNASQDRLMDIIKGLGK
jgi:phage terminase small subunit